MSLPYQLQQKFKQHRNNKNMNLINIKKIVKFQKFGYPSVTGVGVRDGDYVVLGKDGIGL